MAMGGGSLVFANSLNTLAVPAFDDSYVNEDTQKYLRFLSGDMPPLWGFDLDGTVIPSINQLSRKGFEGSDARKQLDQILAQWKRFLEQGGILLISTGRGYDDWHGVSRKLEKFWIDKAIPEPHLRVRIFVATENGKEIRHMGHLVYKSSADQTNKVDSLDFFKHHFGISSIAFWGDSIHPSKNKANDARILQAAQYGFYVGKDDPPEGVSDLVRSTKLPALRNSTGPAFTAEMLLKVDPERGAARFQEQNGLIRELRAKAIRKVRADIVFMNIEDVLRFSPESPKRKSFSPLKRIRRNSGPQLPIDIKARMEKLRFFVRQGVKLLLYLPKDFQPNALLFDFFDALTDGLNEEELGSIEIANPLRTKTVSLKEWRENNQIKKESHSPLKNFGLSRRKSPPKGALSDSIPLDQYYENIIINYLLEHPNPLIINGFLPQKPYELVSNPKLWLINMNRERLAAGTLDLSVPYDELWLDVDSSGSSSSEGFSDPLTTVLDFFSNNLVQQSS